MGVGEGRNFGAPPFESAALPAPSVATASSHGMHKLVYSSLATLSRASESPDTVRLGSRLAVAGAAFAAAAASPAAGGFCIFSREVTQTSSAAVETSESAGEGALAGRQAGRRQLQKGRQHVAAKQRLRRLSWCQVGDDLSWSILDS